MSSRSANHRWSHDKIPNQTTTRRDSSKKGKSPGFISFFKLMEIHWPISS